MIPPGHGGDRDPRRPRGERRRRRHPRRRPGRPPRRRPVHRGVQRQARRGGLRRASRPTTCSPSIAQVLDLPEFLTTPRPRSAARHESARHVHAGHLRRGRPGTHRRLGSTGDASLRRCRADPGAQVWLEGRPLRRAPGVRPGPSRRLLEASSPSTSRPSAAPTIHGDGSAARRAPLDPRPRGGRAGRRDAPRGADVCRRPGRRGRGPARLGRHRCLRRVRPLSRGPDREMPPPAQDGSRTPRRPVGSVRAGTPPPPRAPPRARARAGAGGRAGRPGRDGRVRTRDRHGLPRRAGRRRARRAAGPRRRRRDARAVRMRRRRAGGGRLGRCARPGDREGRAGPPIRGRRAMGRSRIRYRHGRVGGRVGRCRGRALGPPRRRRLAVDALDIGGRAVLAGSVAPTPAQAFDPRADRPAPPEPHRRPQLRTASPAGGDRLPRRARRGLPVGRSHRRTHPLDALPHGMLATGTVLRRSVTP